jgi:putative endonuclease
MPETWYVYILACEDATLYTGITTDPARRLQEHNSAPGAARYTRPRRPVRMVYTETVPDRSAALKREIAIKRLPRRAKLDLIRTAGSGLREPES